MREELAANKWPCTLVTVLILICFVPCHSSTPQVKEDSCIRCETLDLRKAPKYKIARRIKTVDGKTIIHVSIAKDRFTPADLSRLACQFDQDFRAEGAVLVLIFDDYQSAKRYVSRWAQEKPNTWQQDERSQRASYIREPKGLHAIAWYADPLNKKDETSTPICK
jgi:hypothetical protein